MATVFQKLYDKINNWTAPIWLRNLLAELNTLMMIILKEAGKSYVSFLKTTIIEASTMNITNKEKFDYVYKKATGKALSMGLQLRDAQINCMIEFFVNKLKNDFKI